jgi:peptidoglycan/LPS O-acetylase OafA/YrhL
VGRLKLFAFLVVLCIAIWLAYSVIGIREAAVGGLTAATILAFGAKTLPSYLTPLALAGTLSYSLYLVHIPVGGRVINLATRLPDSWVFRYPAIFIAFILSVLAAYILWRLVEKPSQTWSKNSLKRVRKRVESIGENAMVSPTQRSQLN